MSADLWLSYPSKIDGDDGGVEAFGINVTYNLSPMLQACGWTWDKKALEGKKASDIGEAVLHTFAKLKENPEKLRKMNPSNGWGNYDTLVKDWSGFAYAVDAHPDTVVHVWL